MNDCEKIAGLRGAVNVEVDGRVEDNPMGFQLEARAGRPFTDEEMRRLERYAHCLSWIITLDEENGELDIGLVTIRKDGGITVMASSEYDLYRQMDQTMQAMARCLCCDAETAEACGWKCVVRCDEHVLTKGEDGVECDRNGCVYCRRCFGDCPLVVYRDRKASRAPSGTSSRSAGNGVPPTRRYVRNFSMIASCTSRPTGSRLSSAIATRLYARCKNRLENIHIEFRCKRADERNPVDTDVRGGQR